MHVPLIPYSGNDYEHRRQWAVDRLKHLAFVFTIDICSYAIMSNHYHLVLRVDKQKALRIQDRSVVKRWSRLYKIPPLVQDYLLEKEQSEAQRKWAKTIINTWRCRLMDISWFMKCLNEHLARKANDEDKCKGRFFEGRFKSQALLDEGAVLTAMAYVDLNPIRERQKRTAHIINLEKYVLKKMWQHKK